MKLQWSSRELFSIQCIFISKYYWIFQELIVIWRISVNLLKNKYFIAIWMDCIHFIRFWLASPVIIFRSNDPLLGFLSAMAGWFHGSTPLRRFGIIFAFYCLWDSNITHSVRHSRGLSDDRKRPHGMGYKTNKKIHHAQTKNFNQFSCCSFFLLWICQWSNMGCLGGKIHLILLPCSIVLV